MDSGGMAMLGATGGLLIMVYYLLMLVLSILVPFFVWRIWKWSYATSQELKTLNEKFDQLLSRQEAGVPVEELANPALAAAAVAPASLTPQEEVEEPAADEMPEPAASEDPLASAFELNETGEQQQAEAEFEDETLEEPDEAPVEDFAIPSEDEQPAEEETGFEFAVSPEEAFGAEEPGSDEEITAAGAAEDLAFDEQELPTAEEGSDVFAQEKDEEPLDQGFAADDNAFDFDAEEDAEAAGLGQDFDSAFDAGQEDRASSAEEQDPFASFDTGQTATEETDEARQDADEAVEEEEPAAAEPEEEKPAIIPLDPDPQRPTVKLARCGQCDHKLAYKEALSGKKARCPSCKSAFMLP